jgi:hypothetical protein
MTTFSQVVIDARSAIKASASVTVLSHHAVRPGRSGGLTMSLRMTLVDPRGIVRRGMRQSHDYERLDAVGVGADVPSAGLVSRSGARGPT